MELFNLIRGHFALLTNQSFKTPAQNKEFSIKGVSDWHVILNISTGNTTIINITDILKIYTFVIWSDKTLTSSEIADFAEKECVSDSAGSYITPLLGTFSDIQITKEDKFSISFIKR